MQEQTKMGKIPEIMPVSRIFFGTANPPISTAEDSAYGLLDSVLASGINNDAMKFGKMGLWGV